MLAPRTAARILACLAATAFWSCGSKTSTTPTPPPGSANTFTITATGVSPKTLTVSAGSRVLFVNSDTRSHNMTSDPHPEHDACPELNQIGFLAAGQSRESGNLVQTRTCGFHDHDLPDSANLKGSVVIR